MDASAPDHALFRHYPLTGQVQLSTGPAPTPYHIYNGHGVFVGGTADLQAARDLLRPEKVQALQTADGRAVMGVWVVDFTAASLGPHHELQFSLFVVRGPAAPLAAHPLAATQALLARPEARMLCHGLWNDAERVVAYNREALGLNARRCQSRITLAGGALVFEFTDLATGRALISGRLRAARRASVRATFALAGLLGFGLTRRLAAQPWAEMKIVNPVGARPDNDVALAATKSAVNFVRYFDPRADTLTIAEPAYRGLDFQPQFVQHLGGIKFVYLDPQPDAGR